MESEFPPTLPSILIHRTVYSFSEEFSIHRDKGITFIFFNVFFFTPLFSFISLSSAWLPQPLKSFNTVLEKALSEKTPGMFKEKVECSVCQTELGQVEGGAIPQRGYFPL